MTRFDMVAEFHEGISQHRKSFDDVEGRELRASLIAEESAETVAALVGVDKARAHFAAALAKLDRLQQPSIIEYIDGRCDLEYVLLGTDHVYGIDAEPFFREVHRTNMQKLGGPVREDGKRLKPPGWLPPDIAGMWSLGVGRL